MFLFINSKMAFLHISKFDEKISKYFKLFLYANLRFLTSLTVQVSIKPVNEVVPYFYKLSRSFICIYAKIQYHFYHFCQMDGFHESNILVFL